MTKRIAPQASLSVEAMEDRMLPSSTALLPLAGPPRPAVIVPLLAPEKLNLPPLHCSCPDGGTFTSELPVRPHLVFTRVQQLSGPVRVQRSEAPAPVKFQVSPAPSATIPIEILTLHLQSCQPVQVTSASSPDNWLINGLCLDEGPGGGGQTAARTDIAKSRTTTTSDTVYDNGDKEHKVTVEETTKNKDGSTTTTTTTTTVTKTAKDKTTTVVQETTKDGKTKKSSAKYDKDGKKIEQHEDDGNGNTTDWVHTKDNGWTRKDNGTESNSKTAPPDKQYPNNLPDKWKL